MLCRIAALSTFLLGASVEAAKGTYNYDDVEGWKDLPIEGNQCGLPFNSPVALETGDCDLYANYKLSNDNTCTLDDFDFTITNNGVKMGYSATSTCVKPSFDIPTNAQSNIYDTYTHAQTHIHLASEHSIDGEFYAAELHMVHATTPTGGNPNMYSVLGTMIKPGSPFNNPMFERFLARWITAAQATCEHCFDYVNFADAEVLVDVYENMRGKDFYHYDGGLTTPTCDQAVWWNFNTDAWLISPRQYQIMTDLILTTRKVNDDNMCETLTVASKSGSTSRPPQPLNGRTVQKICNLA